MEVVFTAIMGEIANKSISFLIDKCSNNLDTPTEEDRRIKTLQSLLLRACVIVEEADGRNITNQAMVHQLNILRKEMYRGYFVMDSLITSQTSEEDKSKDHDVSSNPFAISKFNPVKRLFFHTRSTHGENELQQVLGNLNNIITDMREFIEFMKEYPPLYRQPYSMHLFLDKCMFGRQMEMERIMNFLMTEGPPSAKDVDVLPIVGPVNVGKSTLVGHVCNDERVRNNFARIVFITEVDIKDNGLTDLKDGGLIIHQNNSPNGNERLLSIIEFPDDVDEAGWKMYLAFATRLAATVKIIITSRSSKIIGFGTTQALILNFLPPEAYWYFFKVITFGSAYPKDHPKLESIAMEICRGINGSFKVANIVSSLLRDSLNARHWFVVHKFLKLLMEMNICLTAHESKEVRTYYYLKRMVNNDHFIIYDYHESFADDMVPKTTLCDVIFGSVRCEGKFKVLSWKSRIPPYKNYIYTCDMKKKKKK
ncbi:putative disease resistance protein RGA1, partial [Setaria italica]